MTLKNTSIALAAIAALAASSAFSAASAFGSLSGRTTSVTLDAGFVSARQPNKSQPATTSRPSNRDLRGASPVGGRGMRSRGRMNGGTGQLRR
jgi:hypothetical protein